jgi:hypothetical protein
VPSKLLISQRSTIHSITSFQKITGMKVKVVRRRPRLLSIFCISVVLGAFIYIFILDHHNEFETTSNPAFKPSSLNVDSIQANSDASAEPHRGYGGAWSGASSLRFLKSQKDQLHAEIMHLEELKREKEESINRAERELQSMKMMGVAAPVTAGAETKAAAEEAVNGGKGQPLRQDRELHDDGDWNQEQQSQTKEQQPLKQLSENENQDPQGMENGEEDDGRREQELEQQDQSTQEAYNEASKSLGSSESSPSISNATTDISRNDFLLDFCRDIVFGIEKASSSSSSNGLSSHQTHLTWLQLLCGAPPSPKDVPYNVTLLTMSSQRSASDQQEQFPQPPNFMWLQKRDQDMLDQPCYTFKKLWKMRAAFPDAKWYIMTGKKRIEKRGKVQSYLTKLLFQMTRLSLPYQQLKRCLKSGAPRILWLLDLKTRRPR